MLIFDTEIGNILKKEHILLRKGIINLISNILLVI